jgi:hypothetical protein
VRHLATAEERRAGYRRVLAARDPHASAALLTELASDTWRPTRINVAEHPHAPGDALNILMRDEDGSVVWRAVRNPNAPAEALEWLVNRTSEPSHLLPYLLHHPNTPKRLRRQLRARLPCTCSKGHVSCPQHWEAYQRTWVRKRE